eukprot:3062583-Rhodomonas_salina.2
MGRYANSVCCYGVRVRWPKSNTAKSKASNEVSPYSLYPGRGASHLISQRACKRANLVDEHVSAKQRHRPMRAPEDLRISWNDGFEKGKISGPRRKRRKIKTWRKEGALCESLDPEPGSKNPILVLLVGSASARISQLYAKAGVSVLRWPEAIRQPDLGLRQRVEALRFQIFEHRPERFDPPLVPDVVPDQGGRSRHRLALGGHVAWSYQQHPTDAQYRASRSTLP